ncbi:MAG TPA: MarR family transcriptional regulator, partial [Trebonia sp.]
MTRPEQESRPELPGPARALREVQQASYGATLALARRLGIGTTEVAALQHLTSAGEPLGPVQLGQRLGIASASATALVDRLERSGHVYRSPHPQDRRRQTISVTQESTDQTREALRPLLADIDLAAAQLTPEQAAAVVRFLGAAADAMRRYAGPSA